MTRLGGAAKYLTFGLELAVTMAVCVGGGYWIDQRFGTLPWGTLGGAVLGIATLALQFYRLVKTLEHEQAREAERRARDKRA